MNITYSDVSLTVLLSITLANDQFDAQIFNTFITILYMYMFRTISCSSSGGQIVLIQHLVSSLSVSDRSVHTSAPDGHLLTGFWRETPKNTDHLEETGVNVKIIIKRTYWK